MRAYKFRIYPSKKQEEKMQRHLWVSKELWNEMLAFTKEIYNNYQRFPTKRTLREMVKQSGLFSQVNQELVDRLIDALHRKIEMKKRGEKGGFPRFKSIDRMKSLNYPQYECGFWLDKKLRVTPFGEIAIKKHREMKGRIKTLTLKKEASGKWFAVFCVDTPKEIPKENRGVTVGIDLGLKTFATLSNGKTIKNPRHLKQYANRLGFIQRKFSRKNKGSSNRKRAKIIIAKLHEKIADTRKDFLHKISIELVNEYSLIALEKLASQDMAEENYGKQINDAGWNMFANMLAYKAEGAGCRVVFVNPKYTTQECSSCHQIVQKDLIERMHNCPFCGLIVNRDINAARNILTRATVGQTGSNTCNSLQKERDVALATSMKQEARTYL
ncbi:IS200/IS605 family element transposase accessory protein TnpB [Candidatus Micrarchaeota archaeon]|nr:IS200/IS605 family element transposase accessory protein TnpB [Candidatus Micrarchaeota archaeon]